MKCLILILLLLFTHAPDPGLRAQWDTKEQAIVSWTQTQRGCLYRESGGERVWVGCYEESGQQQIVLTEASAGDIYVLQTSGHTWRARLVWVWYLALVRKETPNDIL